MYLMYLVHPFNSGAPMYLMYLLLPFNSVYLLLPLLRRRRSYIV
jgi:hypothetical protein